MHRILIKIAFLTFLLTACSKYSHPNYSNSFPSSPSIITEENGWKSLAIIYQRDVQRKPVTFKSPNKSRANTWIGGTFILPVENGQEELILLTDNQLKEYYDYNRPAIEKFTCWIG
jgi:hypothetical protein